jgi:nucleosome binding factor SPN SPT16 subunit
VVRVIASSIYHKQTNNMDKIPEHRKNAFKTKAVFKADELRRRREELQVEIRRKNREESLAKRRNLNVPASPDSDDEAAVATINAQVSYKRVCRLTSSLTFAAFSVLRLSTLRYTRQSY